MKKGFTLIEMLVAVGILSVVILISLSSFLAVLNAQKKSIVIETIQENLRFSAEMMLREIRTGRFYYCGSAAGDFGSGSNNKDCSAGGPALTFKNYLGQVVIYRLFNGQIQKSSDGGASFLGITFPEITISDLKFYVVGSNPPPDTSQPRVTISIKGEAGTTAQRSKSEFNVQTTISQRIIDY